MVMRALVVMGALLGLAGAAAAGGVTIPEVQQGCGADGKLTPELIKLKVKGAANLVPCVPGQIVFVAVKVKGKQVIGFAGRGTGWKVGRVMVADVPAPDAAALGKLLPLKKLKDNEAAGPLVAALLYTQALFFDDVSFSSSGEGWKEVTARAYAGPGKCGQSMNVTVKMTATALTIVTTPAAPGPACK